MNKIRIVSDLHLEMCSLQRFNIIREQLFKTNLLDSDQKRVRNLALLGDIGDPHCKVNPYYHDLIHEASYHYDNVFVIAGNHEYYSDNTMIDTRVAIRKFCYDLRYKNVHFLNDQKYKLGNRIILGTTLWSAMDHEHFPQIEKRLNDCYKIKGFNPEVNNLLHEKSVGFLERQLKKSPGAVVLTHHSPLMEGTCNPIYKNSEMKSCFATDLSELVKQSSVWAFGHTHWPCDFTFEKSRVVSNPIGYPDQLKENYSVYI